MRRLNLLMCVRVCSKVPVSRRDERYTSRMRDGSVVKTRARLVHETAAVYAASGTLCQCALHRLVWKFGTLTCRHSDFSFVVERVPALVVSWSVQVVNVLVLQCNLNTAVV